MEHRTQDLLKEARSRQSSRPLMRGSALAGNAWDDYETAMHEFAQSGSVWDEIGKYPVSGSLTPVPPSIRSYIKSKAPVLEHLRTAIRRSESRFNGPWSGEEHQIRRTLQYRCISLAFAEAAVLREDRLAEDCAERLVDLAFVLRDIQDNTPGDYGVLAKIGWDRSLEEWRELLKDQFLPKDMICRIEGQLESLDRAYPRLVPALRNNTMEFGLLSGGPGWYAQAHSDGELPTSWRYLWSIHLTLADAFLWHDSWNRRAESCDVVPWSEAKSLLDRISASAEACSNAYARGWSGAPERLVHRHHRILVRLRQLRTALRFRASEEVLALPDPFGGVLCHEIRDRTFRVWSVGANGIDDSGESDIYNSPRDDISFEINR
jgi:hypothetical protein